MRLFGVAVLFAMTAGGTAGALGQGSGDPEIVREIRDFVRNVYLTDRLDTVRAIRRTYADPMRSYWGKRNVRLRAVVSDKISYFRRWPDRQFRLVDKTLAISQNRREPDVYRVTFEYAFRNHRPGHTAEGFGETELLLEDFDGRWIILAESGRVVQRY